MITVYRCATCKHESKDRKELDRHFDDKHSNHCKICNYRNISSMAFERHMEYSHNILPHYICKLCKEEFDGNNDFDKHLEFTHDTNHWSVNLASRDARRKIQTMRDNQK